MSDETEKLRALMHQTFRLVGNALGSPTKNIRGWLAIRTGHCDLVHLAPLNPKEISMPAIVPHSMSDMTRAELEVFWDDAREFIRREVFPRIDATAAEEIGWRLDDLRQ